MASWIEHALALYEKRSSKSVSYHPELLGREHLASYSATSGTIEVPSLRDYTDYATVYGTHVWMRKGIGTLTENFAALPVVVRDKDNEVIVDHELTRVLTHPNDAYGAYEMWEMYLSHMILGGEAFFEVSKNQGAARGERAYPREFWVRRPDQVGVVPDKTRLRYPVPAGYSWDDVEYPRDEFIHWKLNNPLSPWRGLSLVGAVREGITIDIFAQAWSKTFLKGGGRPDWALVAPQGITQEEREELENKMSRKFFGWENWHRPIVLEEGVYDIKTLSFPPVDMQWLEQRKMSRDEIAAILGVPDVLMGVGPDTYDNQEKREAAMTTLWVLTLTPIIQHRDNQLNFFFTVIWPLLEPGEVIVTDTSNIPYLQEDQNSKIPLINTLWAKGVSLKDINAYLSLDIPPTPGWDIAYVPAGVVPVAWLVSPPEPEPTPNDVLPSEDQEPIPSEPSIDEEGEEDETSNNEEVEPPGENGERMAHVQVKAFVPKYGSDQHKFILKRFSARVEPWAEKIQRQMGKTFQAQQIATLQRLRSLAGEKQGVENPLFAPEEIWDEAAEDERMYEDLYPILVAAVAHIGTLAIEDLAMGLPAFDPTDPIIIEAIEQICLQYVSKINDTTYAEIVGVLQGAFEDGLGIREMADLLSQYWGGRKSAWQRQRIARTIMGGAANTADMYAWQQTGVVSGHSWMSALVSTTRDSHRIAHGQFRPLFGRFEVGNALMLAPGDPTAPVEEVVNCLCTTLPQTIDAGEVPALQDLEDYEV